MPQGFFFQDCDSFYASRQFARNVDNSCATKSGHIMRWFTAVVLTIDGLENGIVNMIMHADISCLTWAMLALIYCSASTEVPIIAQATVLT